MPQFTIQNTTVVTSTVEIASAPIRILTQKLESLQNNRNEIITASDFLFTGI